MKFEIKESEGIIMPELPEVQTIVNDLKKAGIIGKTIRRASVFWEKMIIGMSQNEFQRWIISQQITDISRRAKYIVIKFKSAEYLLVHLRMTGKFRLGSNKTRRGKHEHIVIYLEDGSQLRYHDTRKFGRFFPTEDPHTILGNLGPEPLDDTFTARIFQDRILPKNRHLKSLLLDQSFIAGLGNIYTDEALWDAKLHPLAIASNLDENEIIVLFNSIRKVLKCGIKNQGTTLGKGEGNFYSVTGQRGNNETGLKIFHKTGKPCLRCGAKIKKIIVGQRSTHICPVCQKLAE